MVFNSFAFAIFLPLVLAMYYCLRHRWQNVWLLVASWVFYGWWDARFLSLLAISTVVDYFCARGMATTQQAGRRRLLLLVSILSNLTILGFFKYFNFFSGSAQELFNWFGMSASAPTLKIILPMGISFYTFQTMAYTIDVYRGKMKPCRNFISFALYVSYFPQLVAGPIERAFRLLPQIEKPRRVTADHLAQGCMLILVGLFKKIAVADAIGPFVDMIFLEPDLHPGSDLLLGIYLFAIQIYCDFSGYSDVARGVSKLLGIDLMVNFRQPYFSSSITEFWQRWHISLSTWLRDYLYIPLGGNRYGKVKTYRNLMLTMLFGGLWHGASWTFVVWGGLHGLYLSVSKLLGGGRAGNEKTRAETGFSRLAMRLKYLLCVIMTFHLVCLTWIFFRADSFELAWSYLTGILTWRDSTVFEMSWMQPRILILVGAIVFIDVMQWVFNDEYVVGRLPATMRGVIYAGLIVILLVLGATDVNIPFIYFQF